MATEITDPESGRTYKCDFGEVDGSEEERIVQLAYSAETYMILVDGEAVKSMSVSTIEDDPSYAMDLVKALAKHLGLSIQYGYFNSDDDY